MTKVLPLYRGRPQAPVERVSPLQCDSGCTRCPLSGRKVRAVCMRAEGEAGGLFVVSDYPGGSEDRLGRPLVGKTGQYLRPKLKQWWSGPIALDNAIKCAPDKYQIDSRQIAACLPYLASTLKASSPTKILAMGSVAIRALTGRSLAPLSVRKGYGWVTTSGGTVPVYLLPNPVVALRNRFLRSWLEEDLQWALTTDPPFGPAWGGEVRVVETEADAVEAEADLAAHGRVAADIESAGIAFDAFQVIVISIAPVGADYAWAWSDAGLKDPGAREVLLRIWRDPKIQKVGSNLKFDDLGVYSDSTLRARLRSMGGDVRLLRKLLDTESDGELEVMAELVGMGGHKEEAQAALVDACQRVGKIAKARESGQLGLFGGVTQVDGLRREVVSLIVPGVRRKAFAYGLMPREICIRYNAADTISTGRLDVLLERRRQDEESLSRVYAQIVLPAAVAVRQIEEWGVHVDREAVGLFSDYLAMRRREIEQQLDAYTWRGFNAASYDDVARLLFKDLGLTSQYATETGKESTAEEALEAVRHDHPVVPLILAHRRVVKLDGNYASGISRFIRKDGRIHPDIKLDGTRSGRPSCRDPNLQTIPRDKGSVEGKMARDLFAAPPGCKLISVDYSQVELRVAALLSRDPQMIRMFREGADFHQATAEMVSKAVWGISSDEVQPQHRTGAKAINFGLLYGQSDDALAATLGVSRYEAAKIREAILGRFRVLANWIQAQVAHAKKTGYCWSWWDGQRARRRSLYRIADKNGSDRGTAERGSYNTPIQGTASEFLVRSMTQVVEWFLDDGLPAKVVLPVHDSLMIEARDDVVEEVVSGVVGIMTSWNSQDVPLVVDVGVGQAWGSLLEYTT